MPKVEDTNQECDVCSELDELYVCGVCGAWMCVGCLIFEDDDRSQPVCVDCA